jgi:predicted nucleotidyltransferase
MYKKVNITRNYLKVLELFTRGFNSEFYIRETSKKLNLSTRTAQIILNDFEKKGVLNSKLSGKTKLYFLNKQNIVSKSYIILAENYKLINFYINHYEIKQFFSNILKHFSEEIILVFGSFARHKEKEESDLDVLIINNKKINKNILNKYMERYSIKINIKFCRFENFNKNDYLIKEIIKNHICINNTEKFIKLIW